MVCQSIFLASRPALNMRFVKGAQAALKISVPRPIPSLREKLISVILGAVCLALEEDKLPNAQILGFIQLLVHHWL